MVLQQRVCFSSMRSWYYSRGCVSAVLDHSTAADCVFQQYEIMVLQQRVRFSSMRSWYYSRGCVSAVLDHSTAAERGLQQKRDCCTDTTVLQQGAAPCLVMAL